MQIVIEALKIESRASQTRAHVVFALFTIAAATYLTMPKNTNVIVYREQLCKFAHAGVFSFPPREFFDAIIREAFLIAVSLYFLLLYAVSWVDSQMSKTTARLFFGDKLQTESVEL